MKPKKLFLQSNILSFTRHTATMKKKYITHYFVMKEKLFHIIGLQHAYVKLRLENLLALPCVYVERLKMEIPLLTSMYLHAS